MNIERLVTQARELGFDWQLSQQKGVFTLDTMFPSTKCLGKDLALVITLTLAEIKYLKSLES